MDLLDETKLLLRRHRIFPKKRLGQHFTVDFSLFERMTECAALSNVDVVLDVGAGLGFLTRFMAQRCRGVLAVELDSRIVAVLRFLLKDLPNVVIVEGDVLKVKLPPFNKVVSIPPYGISSQLIQWLFKKPLDCAVLVLQKEFAHKLAASVGSENYGWLTVLTYYHFDVELLDEVPRSAFFPPPEVNSQIVLLKPRRIPPFRVENEEGFKRLVQVLFTQRNRKVKNAVRVYFKREAVSASRNLCIDDSIPFKDRRVRELAPEDFGVLANVLIR
ncbi:MAG: 16S rRNA (adenine(1518)-N(6)/adenine(1519)-N(6))-dimethyltransferase RsmA [Candidatus Bathyarchaeia archaeon]